MGYLKRIGPKRYRFAYEGPRIDGKRQQQTGTFYDLTKTEAEAELARLEAQARDGEHVRNPNLTFKDLFSEFMEKKKPPALAISTYDRYGMFGKLYLLPSFASMKVRDVRQGHLLDAYAKWRANGSRNKEISGRTVRHVHDLMRCVLNYGVRRDLVARNTAALIAPEDLPKAPKPEPKALNEAEVKRLLEAARKPTGRSTKRGCLSAEPWFAPAVAFSVYTGARRGEVLAVKWSDVNLEGRLVTIRRSLAETRSAGRFFKEPKNGKARTIALPALLVGVLEEHRERQHQERKASDAYKDDDLVFARPDGSFARPWNYAAAVKDLAQRAGLKRISLHDLRDTHASLLAANGVPLEVVSKRLGHSSIGVTAERYLHVYSDRDAAAASVLDTLCG
ncbi:MAG: tyrosine-type recombinase/integrase [Candidatus Cybelea sp.]|jgi:integrase